MGNRTDLQCKPLKERGKTADAGAMGSNGKSNAESNGSNEIAEAMQP
jgi:hypothetical protein